MKVYLVVNMYDGNFLGVFAQAIDAEDMRKSMGSEKDDYRVEEHVVIQ